MANRHQSFDPVNVSMVGFGPIYEGLGGSTPNLVPDTKGIPYQGGSNAFLLYDNQLLGLWVTGITVDLTLEGSKSQGPLTNDFYPHNIGGTTLTVSGIVPNSLQRNRLAYFIRYTHLQMLNNFSTQPNGNIKLAVVSKGQQNARTQKGSPSNFSVYGLIQSIDSGAERFMSSYTYEFAFELNYTTNIMGNNGDFLGLQFSPSDQLQVLDINNWYKNHIVVAVPSGSKQKTTSNATNSTNNDHHGSASDYKPPTGQQ